MRGVGEDSFSKKGESSFLKVLVDLPIEIIMRKRNIKKKEYLVKITQKRVKTNMLNASHTFFKIINFTLLIGSNCKLTMIYLLEE